MSRSVCQRFVPRHGGGTHGFTLVELIVVLALMAMLLAIALPRYVGTTESAKHRVREQNMETLRDAIDKFKGDQGRYPGSLGELVQRQYLRRIPIDPVTGSLAWRIVDSPVASQPGVYDVQPPADPQPEALAQPAAAPTSFLGIPGSAPKP